MPRSLRAPSALLGLSLLLAAAPLHSTTTGASRSTTFTVQTTVVASCSVTASPLNFGSTVPTPITDDVDANTTISATCSINTPYYVALDAGTGPGATPRLRRMSGQGGTVDYAMYTDPGRSTLWGDGSGGTSKRSATGSGRPQTLTVYGRIPAGQSPAAGAYTDVVTVTVFF
jgi:spore coat protein U-like protein